jgi:hypothetical protein
MPRLSVRLICAVVSYLAYGCAERDVAGLARRASGRPSQSRYMMLCDLS